jgi:hypothetical protein
MALRAYLKAGAAFATAGIVAAVPAIAPPLSPHDVKVARDTEVALTANDYQSIVNTFFGKYPGSTDSPGLWGISGVVHQYAKEIAGPNEQYQNAVDGFFASGVSEVVRQYLIASTVPDSPQAALINGFFSGGITEVAHLLTLANTTDPTLVPYINAFYDQEQPNAALKGIPGVIFLRLMASDLTPEQKSVVNDFFQGGATQVVWNQLLARTSDPQQVDTINDFFTGGVTEVVRRQLLSRTTDPNQYADIDAFFPNSYTGYGGGISENVRIRLLAATTDPVQHDLINGFFDEGISEVVRYLLVGPAPVPPEEPEPFAPTTLARFSAPAEEPAGATDPVDATPAAAVASAPAAAAPAAAAPAAAPAEAPKFTAKVKDKSVADETATADLTDGNKAEPVIIVGAGGPKSGSGSWGVFGQIADAVSQAISGAGAAPSGGSPSSTPSGGTDSPS